MATETPELLYHTTLTVTDYRAETSGSRKTVYVLGTHGTIESAKEFSLAALSLLGYKEDDFEQYEKHRPDVPWTHGDGMVVFAKAPAGQEFLVGIDTKPNDAKLKADAHGQIVLPPGVPHLHYVLQTTIDYNRDRSGSYQTTEIEGCYTRREDAIAAARKCLEQLQTSDEFAQYDERENLSADSEVSTAYTSLAAFWPLYTVQESQSLPHC